MKADTKEGLTLGAFFKIGFPVELFVQSSSGGGNKLPDRCCILFVAPVICWTRLLWNKTIVNIYLSNLKALHSVQAFKNLQTGKYNLQTRSETTLIYVK